MNEQQIATLPAADALLNKYHHMVNVSNASLQNTRTKAAAKDEMKGLQYAKRKAASSSQGSKNASAAEENAYSENELQYAQGLVGAMIAKMAPEFAHWWQEQMKNQVAMTNASIHAAQSAGTSQLMGGMIEGTMSGLTAGAGGFGVASDVSTIKETLNVNTEYTGEITKIDGKIDALQKSTNTLQSNGAKTGDKSLTADIHIEEKVDGEEGASGELKRNAAAKGEDDEPKQINQEENKNNIGKLKRERKAKLDEKAQKLKEIEAKHGLRDKILSPNGGVTSSIASLIKHTGTSLTQENVTVQQNYTGVLDKNAGYAGQQEQQSIDSYQGLLGSLNGLYQVNQAITKA